MKCAQQYFVSYVLGVFFQNGTENEQRTSKYDGCIKNDTQTPTHQQ